MPYFPTYEEMQDALESARLKMWHEHGKAVEFGGPEFTLYVMEGLGQMEAPKILDEPQEVDTGDLGRTDEEDHRPSGAEAAASEGAADGKTTVIRSFGVESSVGAVPGDAAEGHEFVSNRNGKKCLDCGEGPDADIHQVVADGAE